MVELLLLPVVRERHGGDYFKVKISAKTPVLP
jgi:hypothetical protein